MTRCHRSWSRHSQPACRDLGVFIGNDMDGHLIGDGNDIEGAHRFRRLR